MSVSPLYAELKVSPLPNHKYKLLSPFTYHGITVPSGFITNGADIPRIFWIFIPPNDSRNLPAVVMHDFLCSLKRYDEADKMFLDIMEETATRKVTRLIMYYGVRLYTKFIR